MNLKNLALMLIISALLSEAAGEWVRKKRHRKRRPYVIGDYDAWTDFTGGGGDYDFYEDPWDGVGAGSGGGAAGGGKGCGDRGNGGNDGYDYGDYGGGNSGCNSGCGNGGTQRKPNQEANSVAQKAAQDAATAAGSQKAAGQAASKVVKTQLAQRAEHAAFAAAVEMAGKQEIWEVLQQQVRESELEIERVSGALESARGHCAEANKLYKQAQNHFEALNSAMKATRTSMDAAELTANNALLRVSQMHSLLDDYVTQHENIKFKTTAAKKDFGKTKVAAQRAAAAASDANKVAEQARCRTRKGPGNGQ